MNARLAKYLVAGAFAFAALPVAGAAAQDDFELAMVIKSTTNPYYNATLAGRADGGRRDRRDREELRPDAVERRRPRSTSSTTSPTAASRRSRSRPAIPTPSRRR